MKNIVIVLFIFTTTQLFATLLDELSQSSSKVPFVSMEIAQEKTISFFDEVVKSKLLIAVTSDGKMRMQTVSPFEAVTIFDGSDIARFEKRSGQWLKLDTPSSFIARKIFDEIRNLFSGDVSNVNYEISQIQERLILVPKNSMVRKAVAKIEIETCMKNSIREISKIKILDSDGDITVLNIVRIYRKKISNDVFDTSKLKQWDF